MNDEHMQPHPPQPDRPASNNWQSPPPPPPATGPPVAQPVVYPPCPYPPRRRSFFGRMLTMLAGMIFVLSILMNLYLLVLLGAQLGGRFDKTVVHEGQEDQQIALYEVVGAIDDAAARQFDAFCDAIGQDPNVKAVVLRVNSPGGGVTAADQMHHRISQLQAGGLDQPGKTVVVSMGATAASGGYYISASADEILAEPTTITGSIGVIMYWPVIKGTLEKIGVEMVVLKSQGARIWKDEGSPFNEPNRRQREHLESLLNDIQKKFEQVVTTGRGQRLRTREVSYDSPDGATGTIKEIEPLNGKIYLAEEAQQLGLVDRIGYLGAAMERAADLAGLPDAKIIRYQGRRGFWDEVFQGRAGGLGLDIKSLDELQTPRVLLMWKAE